MNETLRREVVVDTRLSEIWQRQGAIADRLSSDLSSLHSAIGERGNFNVKYGSKGYWPTTNSEAEAKARIGDTVRPWDAGRVRETLAEIDALRVEGATLAAEAAPLNAEYADKRWSRFFLVTNTGGHIHRDMSCSTCHPTTQYAWLPTLSGLGEDAAVAEQGPRLCSVCFPSAPVEWTLGLPAKVDPDRCPGSGQQTTSDLRRYARYGACPVCLNAYAMSNTGKIRAHKTPKAAKP